MSNTENKAVKTIEEINTELLGLAGPTLTLADVADLYADDHKVIGINQILVNGVIYDVAMSEANVYSLTNTHSTTESQKEGISIDDANKPPAAAPFLANQNAPVETVTEAPVAVIKERVVAPTPVTANAGPIVKDTSKAVAGVLPEVTKAYEVAKMQSAAALNTIVKYMDAMAPAQPQTAESIRDWQVNFMNSMFTIAIAEDVNFPTVYRAVIALVKKNRDTVFSPTLRNRGLGTMSTGVIDDDKMRFLTRLIDLLYVTSGVANISQVKGQVDMNKFLSAVSNIRAKNNFTAFYS